LYPPERNNHLSLTLVWLQIIIVIALIVAVIVILTNPKIQLSVPLKDFDQMVVSDSYRKIDLADGQHFDLSYEAHHDRNFEGLVRYTSMDHEPNFPIISFDILVTSGDFSDPALVAASASNHHFTWSARTNNQPQGTINLLHTVPMNQQIEDKLQQIRTGDTVTIEGWDILKIDGYDAKGNYIGYWQDAGCNTTLVTNVTIH
jgi:hypothetical protein